MKKEIDLTRSVYELVTDHPELADIMAELGFSEAKKPAMLHSVGKLMTIPKGAKMKNIPMEQIVMTLIQNGYVLAGQMPEAAHVQAPTEHSETADSRTEMFKRYLRRLGSGEDLEAVRADFAAEFQDVDAAEIMQAEQELMQEGTPLSEVQRLCDLHSALFHGATRNERIANAEKAVAESLRQQQAKAAYRNQDERAAALAGLLAIPGHPLQTLTQENENLTRIIGAARVDGSDLTALLPKLREISTHYAKKGDLLYPLLKVRYGITGPSDVMWTVDDEIRDEIASLARTEAQDAAWNDRLAAVLNRAEEMIYKEENILFPICATHFSEDEWYGIYHDAKDYDDCLGVTGGAWDAAEKNKKPKTASADGEIRMPGGHLTLEQLTALLNTLPIEISFVDADNMNRYFNEGPKVFKRPAMALDREVFSCHPPKIEPMVRAIIEDFRAGRRDQVPVWMEKAGKTMLVQYMAVRSKDGRYLGTVEVVHDMEFAKEHFQG